MPSPPELLAVALEAAHLGGRRTLAYFDTPLPVDRKSDGSPVTIADREAEQLIRAHIGRAFPSHAIIGEEHGRSDGDPNYRWIIDPIDGTNAFIHGVPFYGVLIGLEIASVPSLGVIYMPALDELLYATRGGGCWRNGRRARVSSIDRLEDATLLCTNITAATARSDAYERLASRTRLQRTWGDCYGHLLVATGRAEIMLDPAMKVWDSAALLPILEEAGGCFRAWDGRPTIWGDDAVSTNAALNAPVMAILKDEKRRSKAPE